MEYFSSVGIAVGITLWQSRTAFHRQRMVEELNPASADKGVAFEPLEQLSGGNEDAMWAIADHLATIQASTLGLNDTFMVCIIGVVPVLLMAFMIPARLGPKPADEPVDGTDNKVAELIVHDRQPGRKVERGNNF